MSNPRRIRLAIAGIHIESSTFSPLHSASGDFLRLEGAAMLARYPFLAEPEFAGIEPVPLAHFRALPGGMVRADCYAAMKGTILAKLAAAGGVDALYFDVHGAMAVEGIADAEADLLAAMRAALGKAVPVTCSQDLHGNVSPALIGMVDIITTYRTAPHVDWMETRERAVRLLLRWLADPQPLFRAWIGIPVLVTGEMSSTESEPGASLYAPLADESQQPGVWDASLWVGYAWADQARARASAVVCGTDAAAVLATATAIANRYWAARADFRFITRAGGIGWCLDEALACGVNGVFLSDAGDNPTAGAAGDVPAVLAAMLAHPGYNPPGGPVAIFASIPDAAAVAACTAAGIGQQVTVQLGGKLDPLHGSPLAITGTVEACADGAGNAGGRRVVVRAGGIRVIITEHRHPFHRREDFLRLGVDPLDHAVTVVKIGYLEPELKAMASHHFLALSPGAVPPRLQADAYHKLVRPIFPFDPVDDWAPAASVFCSAAGLARLAYR